MNIFSNYAKLSLATSLIFGLTLLSGCGGGGNSSTAVTLNSIAVTPATLTVTHGETATLVAIGTYTDGSTADLTTQVAWISAASGTAAVTGSGVVSGDAEGSTTITATLKGITSPTASITVTAATLKSIAVTTTSTTLPKGTSTNLTATGTYSDGTIANISTQVTWNSTSSSTTTVDTYGIVTGVGVGSTKVYASSNGINSPNVDITVTDAVLNSIAITTETVLPKGTTANLIATGTYSDGTTANITTLVTWTSAASLTASVGASTGIVYGAAAGTTTVKAELGNITSSNTSNIHVIAATLNSIAVTPALSTLAKGTSSTLTATGTFSDGSTATIGTVTWHSTSLATATVGPDGTVKGVEVGSTKAYASSNSINSPAVDITVTPAVLTSIAIESSPLSLAKGTSTKLAATGTYSDGATEDITALATWTSDEPATVGANSGNVTSVSIGSTAVFAALDGVLSPKISISVTPVTWNSADKGPDVTLGTCNLTASSTGTWYESVRATIGVSSGKAYWEITPNYRAVTIGIMGSSSDLNNWLGYDNFGWGIYLVDGTLYGIGKNPDWIPTPVGSGSVVGFGLDMNEGTLRIWVDGVDKGVAFTGLTGNIFPASTIFADGVTANFGATSFVTNPLPEGYSADIFQH